MSDDATARTLTGQQLAQRREELDLTQDGLAKRIGVSGRTVSAIERGVNAIQLKNRPAWEKALGLVTGTVSRAYREGAPLEIAQAPAADEPGNDVIATLEARVARLEEALDVERRAREGIERRMAELGIEGPAEA